MTTIEGDVRRFIENGYLTTVEPELRAGEKAGHVFHGNQFGHGGGEPVDAATSLKTGRGAFNESVGLRGDAETQRGLDNYIGTDNSAFVNGYLRMGSEPFGDWGPQVAAVDHAFKTTSVPLSQPISVDRAVGQRVASQLEDGATFTDKAFTSTSYAQHGGAVPTKGVQMALDRADAHDGGGAIMRINLPKGTRVMAGDKSEKELLLDRGSSFKVTGHSTAEDGRTVIHMDLVP